MYQASDYAFHLQQVLGGSSLTTHYMKLAKSTSSGRNKGSVGSADSNLSDLLRRLKTDLRLSYNRYDFTVF